MLSLFSFSGTIGRLKYLGLMILTIFTQIIGFFVATAISADPSIIAIIMIIFVVLAMWIGIAAIVKRIRDIGHPWWFLLFLLIPILGVIFSMYLLFKAGAAEGNYKQHTNFDETVN